MSTRAERIINACICGCAVGAILGFCADMPLAGGAVFTVCATVALCAAVFAGGRP